MNYFSPHTAAEKYAKGRPDFHSNSIQHIKDFLRLENKLDKVEHNLNKYSKENNGLTLTVPMLFIEGKK